MITKCLVRVGSFPIYHGFEGPALVQVPAGMCSRVMGSLALRFCLYHESLISPCFEGQASCSWKMSPHTSEADLPSSVCQNPFHFLVTSLLLLMRHSDLYQKKSSVFPFLLSPELIFLYSTFSSILHTTTTTGYFSKTQTISVSTLSHSHMVHRMKSELSEHFRPSRMGSHLHCKRVPATLDGWPVSAPVYLLQLFSIDSPFLCLF